MSNLPFTLRQLEVFASLAATGSFRRTAEALGISQASVSNQIKTLEDQLGRRLLDRKPGRRPSLTPDGLAFHGDLRHFEQAAATLAGHRVASGQEAQPVRFRLLAGQGMFDGYIRPKLDRFLADNPLIELEFETQLPYDALVRAVDSGRYDFALINQRSDQPADPALQRLALVRGGIYGHRKYLREGTAPLAPGAVSELPFILPQAGSRQERQALASLAQFGIVPRKVVGHTQYYDVMAAMLERGIAVASFSEAVLPASMRDTVVQLIPLDDWYLEFHRKPGLTGPLADALDAFIRASVLDDPHYPAVTRYP